MRVLKLGFLTVILLTLCAGSLFAGGFALSGIGSKAIALGGAFRGMADDGSAMYWNPAGLGFMDRSFITLAGAGIMPTSEFTSQDILVGIGGEKFTAEKKLWLFPNLYAVKACECKFKFGLGAYVPYGLGAEWDIFSLPINNTFSVVTDTLGNTESKTISFGNTANFPTKEMKSSIGVVDFHPTVAYQISDYVSIGAGLSVNYAMIEISKIMPNSILSYYMPTTLNLKGNGIGIGGNFGLMYKPNDVIQVGLSGKLPSTVKVDGDVKASLWVSNLAMYRLHYDGNPHHYAAALPYADVALTFSDTTDAKADLPLPGDLGWGVSWHLNPNWVLNADFTYTFWNKLNKITIDMPDSLNLTLAKKGEIVLNTAWKDTYRVSLGTQITLNKVDLRGGFFYDQSPIPYSSLSPTWPDTSEKYSGNFGLGLHLGSWTVDANYEHIFFNERVIKVQTADNMFGTYNTDINAFNAALTYNF